LGSGGGLPAASRPGAPTRCGVVAIAGRANVGKSTLLNCIAGRKVSIVSPRPQTTRFAVRAVLTRAEAQAVFVDTPGLHKPKSALGQHLNRSALAMADDADLVMLVVDGKAGAGRGDYFVAERLARRDFLVLNKVDLMKRAQVLGQLSAVSSWGFEEYFAVSAQTGEGVDELAAALLARLGEGPWLFPGPGEGGAAPPSGIAGASVLVSTDERQWVAELVREQLLAIMGDELPYSIACEVTDWDWPFVRCEIWVERRSQMGIVIGKGGSVLKRVGTQVRAQLPPGTYLELRARVRPNWQAKPEALARLGLSAF
jgi:GTP-binding protein Era